MTIGFDRRTAIAGGLATLGAASAASAGPPVTGEGYAPVPGGRIWWRRVGNGPKTPLLLLHGGPGAGHNYLKPMAALADERPVIFYDQLGCGRADSPPDEKIYTIQRSVDEVDAVRKALKLDRIVLFGHSWGSMLAIEYMCQGRGRGVEKLIVGGALASTPQFVAGTQRLIARLPGGAGRRMHALERAGQTASPEYQKLVQQFYDLHVCRRKPTPPDVQQTLDIADKSIAYRVMNGPNEFTVTGVIKDWERRPDLHRIVTPTLITTGEFDEVTIDCHQAIHHGVKGSQLVVMPGCSHITMGEKPEAYNAIVRHFIA